MFKIVYYVPLSHLELTKQALFNAGAGCCGQYEHVCWQSKGEGQFRPLPGSRPFLGKTNCIETVVEYRVELLCCIDKISAAIEALVEAHPYEQPAYEAWQLDYPKGVNN